MNNEKPLLMLSAGEASGDIHASHVINELKNAGFKFDCFGMGANKLNASGMELVLDCRDLAVIGIVDVLLNYPKFMKRLDTLRQAMKDRRPDLLIIVDYPDFNLKLAETAKELGIPVLFYISPQVWAWRKKRISRIGSLVSHMAVLFPFEVDVYQQAGIPVTYVGHPLVDDAKSNLSKVEACEHLHLSARKPVLALLPGSRTGELKRNLPVMLETALALAEKHPSLQLVLPVAETLELASVDTLLGDARQHIHTVTGQSYTTMRAADAVLTASGTATLETALIGTPMVIMYVVNPINYAIMNRLIEIDDIGLVNIVAGKRICQEFIQSDAKPEKLVPEIERCLFDNDYRSVMVTAFEDVQERMGTGGASTRVAALVQTMLN